MISAIKISDSLYNDYAYKLNDYHRIIQSNYDKGKITLKEKCKAHQNVDEMFMDFYIENSQLVK
jgi:hypothetical protein